MRALSKGNRQKVQLIAALASRADLLVLDEPTSGLDPLMEVAFRESVGEAKRRGQTVFLSSHILSEVEALCDRVGVLSGGRLVDEGTLDQLRHLSAHTVEVTFEGAAPRLPPLPGVRARRRRGRLAVRAPRRPRGVAGRAAGPSGSAAAGYTRFTNAVGGLGKPVRCRRGPATVTGSKDVAGATGASHWGGHRIPGKVRQPKPRKPGNLSPAQPTQPSRKGWLRCQESPRYGWPARARRP